MQIHDIYPVEEIVEYSFYWFMLYVFLLLLFIYLLLKLYKKIKTRPLSPLEILELSDYSQAKEMAFKLSYYGESLIKTPTQKALFLELKAKLTPFKYAKEDEVLNQTIQDEIQNFLTSDRKHHD